MTATVIFCGFFNSSFCVNNSFSNHRICCGHYFFTSFISDWIRWILSWVRTLLFFCLNFLNSTNHNWSIWFARFGALFVLNNLPLTIARVWGKKTIFFWKFVNFFRFSSAKFQYDILIESFYLVISSMFEWIASISFAES